jgi:hypothetical protein
MKDWRWILNTKINGLVTLLENDQTAGAFPAAKSACWDLWQEAAAEGFDTSVICWGDSERAKFENFVDGLINEGF